MLHAEWLEMWLETVQRLGYVRAHEYKYAD